MKYFLTYYANIFFYVYRESRSVRDARIKIYLIYNIADMCATINNFHLRELREKYSQFRSFLWIHSTLYS